MNILELENVALTYFSENGETEALRDVSFSVSEGEFVAILGPSGSGKTTILSLISGLLTPTKGKVLINNKEVSRLENKSGYMFQKDHLFEWKSVLKNIYLGLEIKTNDKIKKIKKSYKDEFKKTKGLKNKQILRKEIKNKIKTSLIEDKEYANELLKKYGLWEFRNKYPNQLSGGMRQRVALIRTLALKPDVLLLDEPFSALDYQTRLNLCDDVSSIIKNENKTAILVTHDITEALSMANRIILLTKRPAEIKKTYNINIGDNLTPLKKRESGAFLNYFDCIWKELQSDDEF